MEFLYIIFVSCLELFLKIIITLTFAIFCTQTLTSEYFMTNLQAKLKARTKLNICHETSAKCSFIEDWDLNLTWYFIPSYLYLYQHFIPLLVSTVHTSTCFNSSYLYLFQHFIPLLVTNRIQCDLYFTVSNFMVEVMFKFVQPFISTTLVDYEPRNWS